MADEVLTLPVSELALRWWIQLPFDEGPAWVQVKGLLRPVDSGDKINSGDEKWRVYAVRGRRRMHIRVAGDQAFPVCDVFPGARA
ncbi:MAG TPA: hypothetical protein VGM60_20260 [Pseudonocardia sp.]|jgi:hypothetical protein|uniref:hypothetical protein n=1 Tax=Pseudonocardia sp. TaxID=60912 RepID=UPI002F3F3B15